MVQLGRGGDLENGIQTHNTQAHLYAYQGSHVGPIFRLQSFVTQPPTKAMTTGAASIFGHCNYSGHGFPDYKQLPIGVKP